MSRSVLQLQSGPDGKLHREAPVEQPDTDFEVEVVIRPRPAARAFPPGYFDRIGSVKDERFTVHSKPPLPPPLEIE